MEDSGTDGYGRSTRYQFGDFEIDTARFELRRAGTVVHMERQVFDVLAYLIAHRDRVVPKAELLEAVWTGRFVSESALASRIKVLRRSVGDDGTHQAVIRTVFGRGYQFVAEVSALADAHTAPGPADVPEMQMEQEIHVCRAGDGTRLAYSVVGSGPVLVKAANWMTHLDYDLEHPVWRHGPRTSPAAGHSCDTTNGVAASRIGTSTGSTSIRGSTTSRRWSTTPSSTGSPCSASPRAARSPWPSPSVAQSA